ncbi:MAG: hypothetical protein MSG64_07555 [Pyrinomonadaceae bacterium MAG19_C2-C3]|nr:hypothetical protein [Pyrinomonadaceae bacterium MAG19_C2-C3]
MYGDTNYESSQATFSFIAIEGIVEEVGTGENAGCIKARMEVFSESIVHDEWIQQMTAWVGKDGYGLVEPPEVGSEVAIFGRLGEGHTLFYVSRHNEDFRQPSGFEQGERGFKTDGGYRGLADGAIRFLAQQLVEVKAQTTMLLEAVETLTAKAQTVNIESQNFNADAGGEVIEASGGGIGFLGAGATGKIPLPPDASNLGTVIALANAIKTSLKTRGFS